VKKLSYFLPVSCLGLIYLAGCTSLNVPTTENTAQNRPTGFSIHNEDYLEPGSTPARLINLSSQALRDYQSHNTSFKTSIFDLREMNGLRDYKDSNYHIHQGIFTVTYRPHTFYGSNTSNFTPYCPVFYDSHQKQLIENYIVQINRVFPVSLNDLSEYLMLSSFSTCALLNHNYQTKQPTANEHDTLVVGDKFAITILMHEGKMDMVNMIVNHNDVLHEQNIMNKQELKNYYQKTRLLLQQQNIHNPKNLQNKTLYEWWQNSAMEK
jgi:hypothetical protein